MPHYFKLKSFGILKVAYVYMMSKATKRKHVTKEVLNDFVLPEGHQKIVKVLYGRGNNLHEVETPGGDIFLASMPTKFRKNVWIKRGDYVMTEPIDEGDKVKAEIINILYRDQIKHIKENGLWPAEFDMNRPDKTSSMIPDHMLPPSDEDSDLENEPIVMNTNRQQVTYSEDDTDSDDENDHQMAAR